jgi:hypothetical protein
MRAPREHVDAERRRPEPPPEVARLPAPPLPASLLAIQRSAGNAAATRLVTPSQGARVLQRMSILQAPPAMTVPDAVVRGVMQSLQQTHGDQREHGGVVVSGADDELEFRPKADGAQDDEGHFHPNLEEVDREQGESLFGVLHTHPKGTMFSGADFARTMVSSGTVEFVATASKLYAIFKTDEFDAWREQFLMQRIAQPQQAVAELQDTATQAFDAHFDTQMTRMVESVAGANVGPEIIDVIENLSTYVANMRMVEQFALALYAGDIPAAPEDGIVLRRAFPRIANE